MNLSIIIPTYNEAANIAGLVAYLRRYAVKAEIIVTDAGSADSTVTVAGNAGARAITAPQKGRAAQMNAGAAIATGDVFYFIHADTFPPVPFVADIEKAIAAGYSFGRYRTRFDSNQLILKMNAFFTRFDLFVCYGGDQTLFMTKELFNGIAGFDTAMQIMEDYDIVTRAKGKGRYKIMKGAALISARKYDTNSWYKVQKANYTIVQMFKKGASQADMVHKYKQLLNYR